MTEDLRRGFAMVRVLLRRELDAGGLEAHAVRDLETVLAWILRRESAADRRRVSRLAVVEEVSSAPSRDGRGRSPVKSLIASASLVAKSRDAHFTHRQICERLEPHDILGYAIALAAAATTEPKRRVNLAANVIYEMGEVLWERERLS